MAARRARHERPYASSRMLTAMFRRCSIVLVHLCCRAFESTPVVRAPETNKPIVCGHHYRQPWVNRQFVAIVEFPVEGNATVGQQHRKRGLESTGLHVPNLSFAF